MHLSSCDATEDPQIPHMMFEAKIASYQDLMSPVNFGLFPSPNIPKTSSDPCRGQLMSPFWLRTGLQGNFDINVPIHVLKPQKKRSFAWEVNFFCFCVLDHIVNIICEQVNQVLKNIGSTDVEKHYFS